MVHPMGQGHVQIITQHGPLVYGAYPEVAQHGPPVYGAYPEVAQHAARRLAKTSSFEDGLFPDSTVGLSRRSSFDQDHGRVTDPYGGPLKQADDRLNTQPGKTSWQAYGRFGKPLKNIHDIVRRFFATGKSEDDATKCPWANTRLEDGKEYTKPELIALLKENGISDTIAEILTRPLGFDSDPHKKVSFNDINRISTLHAGSMSQDGEGIEALIRDYGQSGSVPLKNVLAFQRNLLDEDGGVLFPDRVISDGELALAFQATGSPEDRVPNSVLRALYFAEKLPLAEGQETTVLSTLNRIVKMEITDARRQLSNSVRGAEPTERTKLVRAFQKTDLFRRFSGRGAVSFVTEGLKLTRNRVQRLLIDSLLGNGHVLEAFAKVMGMPLKETGKWVLAVADKVSNEGTTDDRFTDFMLAIDSMQKTDPEYHIQFYNDLLQELAEGL